MKLLLFANTDWYLYNFRLGLAEAARRAGYEPLLVSPPGPYGERLCELGFAWRPFPFSTRSTNPLAELGVLRRLAALYRAERPQLVHHFTIKCVLYGSVAARLTGGVPTVNAVTGLGHLFTDPGLKARLLRPPVRAAYRLALNAPHSRTIFQNGEDRDFFIAQRLVRGEATRLIRGSGVSGARFRPQPLPAEAGEGVTVLFASRLLREKGVAELLAALRLLREKGCRLRLLVAGERYPGNPSSLTAAEVDELRRTPGVEYLGHVDDMPALLAQSDIVVLPSYREGTPRILVEAAAAGRPIVATAIAGCRGLVEDGVNGLLVPVGEVVALAHALRRLADDPDLRVEYGRAGRRIFEAGFAEEQVVAATLAVYREVASGPAAVGSR